MSSADDTNDFIDEKWCLVMTINNFYVLGFGKLFIPTVIKNC